MSPDSKVYWMLFKPAWQSCESWHSMQYSSSCKERRENGLEMCFTISLEKKMNLAPLRSPQATREHSSPGWKLRWSSLFFTKRIDLGGLFCLENMANYWEQRLKDKTSVYTIKCKDICANRDSGLAGTPWGAPFRSRDFPSNAVFGGREACWKLTVQMGAKRLDRCYSV